MAPWPLADDPSRCVTLPRPVSRCLDTPKAEALLQEEVAVVESSRQHRCGAGRWLRAVSARVQPLSLLELCRELSTELEASPGFGGRGRSVRPCETPRQRRLLRCVLCATGQSRGSLADDLLPRNETACTISGTQCMPTQTGAADQPERLPWILSRSHSFSLALSADVRRPLGRPSSFNCSIRRLRFRSALGWCWRGGGW